MVLLELSGVGKKFRSGDVETHALRDIDLKIDSGDFLAIEGPSGCGKSTLLSVLGLLESVDQGDFWLNGAPVNQVDFDERCRLRNRYIGFIFQSFNLLAGMHVLDNVLLPLRYRSDLTAAERRTRAEAALEAVGMTHRLRHWPTQLSGGQQQRVAIARAIAGDPLLLLADEPTGNLDRQTGEEIMRLFQHLHARGTTLVMVTHNAKQAELAGQRIAMLDGRLRASEI